MLRRLAEFTARRPKLVLGVVVALLGISIVFGGAVAEKLGVGGFTDPASESAQADAFLDETFGATTNLVIQVIARNGTVDEDSDIAATAEDIERIVEEETGAKVIGSFRTDSGDDLRSSDGTSGLILVHIEGTADEAAAVASRIIDRLPTADRDVVVRAGGTLGVQDEINDRVDRDLVISEAIAVPISLAVLVIVFGLRKAVQRLA